MLDCSVEEGSVCVEIEETQSYISEMVTVRAKGENTILYCMRCLHEVD